MLLRKPVYSVEKFGDVTKTAIGFVQTAGGVAEKVNEVTDSITKGARNIIGFATATQVSTVATTEQAVASEVATVSQIGFATATQVATVAEREQAVATTALGAKQLILDGINKILTVSSTIMWAAMTGGISLLIVGIAAVVTYFTSMQEGIDSVMGVFRPLSALFNGFIGVVQNLGKGLVDTFSSPKKAMNDLYEFVKGNLINRFTAFGVILEGIINLDFKKITNGALQAATGVENVTGKLAKAAKETNDFVAKNLAKGKEINALTLQIEKSQLALNKSEIEAGNQKEKNLLISKDASKSFSERAKAAEAIIAIEQKQGDLEAEIINKKIKRLKIEQSLKDTGRTGQQELIDLQVELDNAQDRGQDSRLEQMKVLSGLKKEQNAIAAQYSKEQIERDKVEYASKYELEKQRLNQIISINEEIAKDEEKTNEERIKAVYDSQQAQEDLLLISKQNQLANDKLTSNDRIRIQEDYANKVEDLNKKVVKEVAKINAFDSKSYEDNIKRKIATVEIANNEEIAAEEKRFQDELALGYANDKAKEDAAKKHEKKLFEIKKEGLLAITRIQLANLSAELDAYEKKAKEDGKITQEESDYILAKRKELSDLSVRLIQAEGGEFTENEKNKTLSAKEQAEKILEISQQLTGALSNLGNAFSQAKIQKIDDEISKNNEFYDKQIALAENDARKKDFLEKERARKNDILEKKKREAQRKQAIFEKAVAIAQIAIQTALAIVKAAPNPFAVAAAAVLGAIQLATAIATPIPKYKHGRKGGPAELAIVGDGGVSEIITSGDGSNPRLTPNVPTLTKLGKDDIVHKSMSDYENYVKQSIILNFKNENQKIKELNSGLENGFSKEILEEMKRNTRAIEKGKPIILGSKPIDIPHSIWAFRNINWRA
jgi:hypothetical protein